MCCPKLIANPPFLSLMNAHQGIAGKGRGRARQAVELFRIDEDSINFFGETRTKKYF